MLFETYLVETFGIVKVAETCCSTQSSQLPSIARLVKTLSLTFTLWTWVFDPVLYWVDEYVVEEPPISAVKPLGMLIEPTTLELFKLILKVFFN